jgi:hypothetical protein
MSSTITIDPEPIRRALWLAATSGETVRDEATLASIEQVLKSALAPNQEHDARRLRAAIAELGLP